MTSQAFLESSRNRKYEEPRVVNGKRTRAGMDIDNERKRRANELRKLKRESEPSKAKARKAEAMERFGQPEVWADTPREIALKLYRTWNEGDVERWFSRAKELGARVSIKPQTMRELLRMELVPNEPYRIAFEATPREHRIRVLKAIARNLKRMEKWDGKEANTYGSETYEDGELVRKHLGVQVMKQGSEPRLRIFCTYQLAEACCAAMDLAATDCGI